MGKAREIKGSYVIVDRDLVHSLLDEEDRRVTDLQADAIVDYIANDLLDEAWQLIIDGYNDIVAKG